MSPSSQGSSAGRPRLNSKTLGVLCVLGAVTAFSTQDMAIKWLSGDYALHQIVFTRALVGLAFTLAVLMPLEGGFSNLVTRRLPMHLLRGATVVLANMTFFTGLAVLPLGEATAIFFVAPLFVTLLSIPILGEQVGRHRWAAVLIGLGGVVVMLQPGGAAFQVATLLPLSAAFCYAMLLVLTRRMGVTEKASTMAFYIQISFVFISAAIGLGFGDGRFEHSDQPLLAFLLRAWVWPPPGDLAIMIAVGLGSGVGGYLISQAYRSAEATLLAPFEYVALPMAIFWSVFIWGDWPKGTTWIGIVLIAGAGLYVFYRETRRGPDAVVQRPSPDKEL